MFSPFVQKTICETLIWKSNIFFAKKKAFTFDIFFCIDFDFSEAPFMMKSDFKKNKYFLQIVLSKVLGEIFETVTKAQLDPFPALVSVEKCSFLTLRSIWNIWSLLNEALIWKIYLEADMYQRSAQLFPVRLTPLMLQNKIGGWSSKRLGKLFNRQQMAIFAGFYISIILFNSD